MEDWARALLVMMAVIALSVGLGFAVGTGGLSVLGLPLPVAAAAVALLVNLGAWIPAAVLRSERFYDLTGSLTYLSLMGLSAAAAGGGITSRAALACALVGVWAVRLGVFLALRIWREGKDGRFDDLKTSAARFLVPWSLQALWASVCSLPVLALVAQGGGPAVLLPSDVLGFGLWLGGFAIEVVADQQKAAFKAAGGRGFIRTGLWAWSQHPNYFGEILLWTGLFIVGAGVFSGTQWLAGASPLLVALLLLRVSGIPMVDARAEARFGADPAWQAYRRRTPLLIPRPPRR